MEHRAAVANELIQTATSEPDLLKKVITGDESWVYGYDPEMKVQSSRWKSPGSPHQEKAQQSCSKIKTMLTVFLIARCCPSWVCPSRPKQLIRTTTSVFFIGQEMQYDENGRSYGQLVIGSFITTMHPLMHHVSCRVFWWNMKSPRWLSFSEAQIWCPATSGFS